VLVLLVADQAAELQAMSEGLDVTVVDAASLEFLGELFRLGESIGLMPLMKFAHAANSGLDSDDMAGLAALYSLVRDTIHPDDWDRFERLAIEKHAEGDEIFEFVGKAIASISARPSQRRSVSSNGAPPTSPNSTASSFVKPPPAGSEGLIPVAQLMRQGA
jgi:hypothetical protein